jgi:hypothetical protein
MVALAGAETALRLFAPQPTGPVQYAWNPELGQVQVPHQKGRRTIPGVYSYSYTNNSMGIRGTEEYAAGRRPGVRRILLLGDSFTYGVGVDDEQTFAVRLERILDSTDAKTEVINAGVGGTGTDYALNFFLKAGRPLEPDAVALFFYWNDFGDNAKHSFRLVDGIPAGTAHNPVEAKSFTGSIPGYNWLVARSHLANLLKQAAIRWTLGKRESDAVEVPPAERMPVQPGQNELDETAGLIRTLHREVERAGAEFLLFYVPTEGEVERYRRGEPATEPEAFLAGVGGTSFHSFTPVLAGSPVSAGELYFTERHWTSAAHRIVAGHLANLLGARTRTPP